MGGRLSDAGLCGISALMDGAGVGASKVDIGVGASKLSAGVGAGVGTGASVALNRFVLSTSGRVPSSM